MRCRAYLLLLALPRAGSLAQRADRAAVVKLYHLLNGPWWHRNANWDDDKGDPCAYAHDHNLQEPWDGIHCLDPCSLHIDGLECYSGRITVIHLERNNLTGSITAASASRRRRGARAAPSTTGWWWRRCTRR